MGSLPTVEHCRTNPSPRVHILYPGRDGAQFVEAVLAGTLVYLPTLAESVLIVTSDRDRIPMAFVCIGNLEAIEMVTRKGSGQVLYNVVTPITRKLEELGVIKTPALTFPLLPI